MAGDDKLDLTKEVLEKIKAESEKYRHISKDDLEEFKENIVWKAIEERLNRADAYLGRVWRDKGLFHADSVGYLQGMGEMLNIIRLFPNALLNTKKIEELINERRERKDDEAGS